jgi:hypothetical protein
MASAGLCEAEIRGELKFCTSSGEISADGAARGSCGR